MEQGLLLLEVGAARLLAKELDKDQVQQLVQDHLLQDKVQDRAQLLLETEMLKAKVLDQGQALQMEAQDHQLLDKGQVQDQLPLTQLAHLLQLDREQAQVRLT